MGKRAAGPSVGTVKVTRFFQPGSPDNRVLQVSTRVTRAPSGLEPQGKRGGCRAGKRSLVYKIVCHN